MVQSMVNEQERIKAAFAELFRQMDKDMGAIYGQFACGLFAATQWGNKVPLCASRAPHSSADKDRQGTLDIHQFENSFHVESVRSCFEALGIKAADAWTIFRSLDKDGVARHHA